MQIISSPIKAKSSKKRRWVAVSDGQLLAIKEAVAKMDTTAKGYRFLQQLIESANELKIR